MDGGRLGLFGLIRLHRGAVEYDLRRLGLGLRDVGVSVSLPEASRLLEQAVSDPASHVGAELRGWGYPVSHEALVLMDLYDLLRAVNSDPKKARPKPYPRPWGVTDMTVAKPSISQEEVLAALRYAGHTNLPG